MNALTAQKTHGYGAKTHGYGANVTRTHKDTEYHVFSRVTRMLRQAVADGDRAAEIEAADKNNQLWTILAADIAAPGNALSDELKAGLMSLAIFSIRHGHAVLAGKADSDVLVDINLSVMKGLRGEAQS